MWQPTIEAVAFARAMGATELFVHVPLRVDRLPDQRATIVRIVDAAHASGLRVAALGGDASWLDDPDDVVERWLTPALAAAAFDGIHLDVEPPIDPDDPDPALVSRFLGLVRRIAGSRPRPLPVDLDVRFWYWQVRAGQTDLQSALLAIADAVTVLSYRTATAGVDGSIAITRPTASARPVPARPSASPRRRGTSATIRQPASRRSSASAGPTSTARWPRVDASFAGSPHYAGTAIHDWLGWQTLT